MEKFERKLERISALEQLLLACPQGLKQAEIARRLGVHRSTVSRWLTDITGILPVYDEDGRVMLNRDSYLNNVKLTVHEIMVLHLAARLFDCRTDKNNPHACSAVRKLGNCLRPYSRRMSDFLLATAASMETRAASLDKDYITVLEKITRAWSDGVWLKIRYFSHTSGEVHEYRFAPWFVQPYAAGRTVYAVGFCREKNHRITLKVERIREAVLLAEKYEIPDSFDPDELFRNAWGIWYADGEPVEICLEFSARVAERVTETVWHQSQSLEKLSGGGLLWKARIAEPLELFPWIRGWGSDVRIRKPEELRRQHIADLKIALEKYEKK
ncbi:MAG: WYL domain-containing transcriptional regulator [Spirochaetia bacterium]